MIISVTLNPCVDYTLFVDELLIGDTNRVQYQESDAGGKGINLSRIVAEIGAPTVATGFLGGEAGKYIRKVLDEQGVTCDFVSIEGETRSNFNIESTLSAHPPTTLNSRGPHISEAEWEQLRDKVCGLTTEACWVALGGSVPPGLGADAFAELIQCLRATPAKILLDADGEPLKLGLDAKPDMIKPNTPEAERILGRKLASIEDVFDGAKELLGHVASGGTVIISRGADGAVLAHGDQVWVGESPQIQAKSTVGSGDSLLGGYLGSLALGRDPHEAFQWGLAAGAATATTDGTEIGRLRIIKELLPRASVRAVR